MHSKLSGCIAVLVLAVCSGAAAQTTVEDFESPEYQEQLDPAWGVTPKTGARARPTYRAYGAFDIGVPVMLDVDRDLVRPGANLHAQGGWDFGYGAIFLHGGWRWIPVDFNRARDAGVDTYGASGRTPLKNPYFGIGLRGQIPNSSRFLPYASVSFDFNFWNFREQGVACGGYYYWWCNGYDVYRFTPGFSGRIGTGIELVSSIYLDLGLGVSMSFEGDFFDKNRAWLEPYLGVMHRF